MKCAVLLALLSAGVCLGATQAQAQYAQFEVSNLTLSGGDPLFSVTDNVTFQNMTPSATLLTLGIIGLHAGAQITVDNWGSVTTPVFGSAQARPYAGAELFAGPNQFGSYYAGVLPNGRKPRQALPFKSG